MCPTSLAELCRAISCLMLKNIQEFQDGTHPGLYLAFFSRQRCHVSKQDFEEMERESVIWSSEMFIINCWSQNWVKIS